MGRTIARLRPPRPGAGCLIALLAAGSGIAVAQESAPDNAGEETTVIVQQAGADAPQEEIVVVGERTRGALLREAGRATEEFYMLLNDVLQRPEFEIRCSNEYPPGSNILQRVCRTRYQERLESRAALSARQGFGVTDEGEMVFSGSSFNQATDLLVMKRDFEDAVLEAVNTDPELNRSVLRLMTLKQAIDDFDSREEQGPPEQ